jgi:phenylalanyl-tRNA synthetase beta chain
MLEIGQPLHAFDFDELQKRAGTSRIKINTRTAMDGEVLKTLDGVERRLSALNVLVCDAKGALSIAGVMGGAESEVTENTRNVLLEGAAWDFINIRRTARQHNLPSEASFRFSRGVHPALALTGVQRGLHYMSLWSGGSVAPGVVDEYPLKPKPSTVTFTPTDVKRLLGVELGTEQIVKRLQALEFTCKVQAPARRGSRSGAVRAAVSEPRITVTAPAHRMDIGRGIVGLADVMEEIARMVGYDRIPSTTMADALPPQVGNPVYEWAEHLRDLLVAIGFDEVVGYRLTSVEREAMLDVKAEHLRITNPVAPERSVLRRSLLASVLDVLEANARWRDSLAFFEIGPVFEPAAGDLPRERRLLALAMTGPRQPAAWDSAAGADYDFYDMKGRVEMLFAAMRLGDIAYVAPQSAGRLHPGKAAEIRIGDQIVGAFGELHPVIKERYSFGQAAVLVAELDLDVLRGLQPSFQTAAVLQFPPVLEDIAIILDESVPAARVEALIRESGGPSLVDVRLFDLYRGEQISAGKKSLAYALTYQAADKTLTDADAAAIRNRVVKRLEQELGAQLRG